MGSGDSCDACSTNKLNLPCFSIFGGVLRTAAKNRKTCETKRMHFFRFLAARCAPPPKIETKCVTKRLFNHIQKDFLINVWGNYQYHSRRFHRIRASNRVDTIRDDSSRRETIWDSQIVSSRINTFRGSNCIDTSRMVSTRFDRKLVFEKPLGLKKWGASYNVGLGSSIL